MKLKFTITATLEYAVSLEKYSYFNAPEEVLAAFLSSAEEDPYMFIGINGVDWDIKGEIVEV